MGVRGSGERDGEQGGNEQGHSVPMGSKHFVSAMKASLPSTITVSIFVFSSMSSCPVNMPAEAGLPPPSSGLVRADGTSWAKA